MKNRSIARVTFKTPPTINHKVKGSLDKDKDMVEMSISQVGIVVKDAQGVEKLIPWDNVLFADLDPEEPEAKHK